jgi:SAM-dependent methyltransferase
MTSATAYADPALYDLVNSWYDVDIDFYVETAKAARGPVLEVACGTGRILIPTLAAGVDIDGFDIEPAMLEHLERKAAARGLAARTQAADMRDFTMPRSYRLITIPFRAFMHLHTTDDQIRALRCMREHLEAGGSLVFNLFYPNFQYMLEHDDKRYHERDVTDPETGRPVAVWGHPRYDRVNQILTQDRDVVFTDAHGVVTRTARYRFQLRWAFRYEMEMLLRAAGFHRFTVWGGFDRRPLERDTDEMVWTAWRD